MHVIKQKQQAPAPPPVVTYDIIGLTPTEAQALSELIHYGYLNPQIPAGTGIQFDVMSSLRAALPDFR